jgi:hypothetical protein
VVKTTGEPKNTSNKAGNPATTRIVSLGGHHMGLTRRNLLAGAAGIATAPLLPSILANAAAPMADKQAPSFYRYKVGDIQVTVVDCTP